MGFWTRVFIIFSEIALIIGAIMVGARMITAYNQGGWPTYSWTLFAGSTVFLAILLKILIEEYKQPTNP